VPEPVKETVEPSSILISEPAFAVGALLATVGWVVPPSSLPPPAQAVITVINTTVITFLIINRLAKVIGFNDFI